MRISIVLLFAFAVASCARAQNFAPTHTQTPSPTPAPLVFDGTHAYQKFLLDQMKIGSRPAGSPGARATAEYILAQLQESGWKTETQEFVFRNLTIRNVIGKTGEGRGAVIIIGAHYDTRPRADQDKTRRDQPVPGANDGASGVAVLLELARTLDRARLESEVWLAFFDAEDNGDLPGCVVNPNPCDSNAPWTWSVGSNYMAEKLTVKPESVIIVDMIGDADQTIYYEQNSDKALQEELWSIATRLGYSQQFIKEFKWSMSDDHTPFLQRGIRAVDIIDFDYPYWHTIEDTADKVSAASLERVGRMLEVWLEGR